MIGCCLLIINLKQRLFSVIPKPKFIDFKRFKHNIEHDEGESKFYIELDADSLAFLKYKLTKNVMDLQHVGVPIKYTYQGLARILTEAAFAYAQLKDYKLYLSCPYVQSYYLLHRIDDRALRERIIGPKRLIIPSADEDD